MRNHLNFLYEFQGQYKVTNIEETITRHKNAYSSAIKQCKIQLNDNTVLKSSKKDMTDNKQTKG